VINYSLNLQEVGFGFPQEAEICLFLTASRKTMEIIQPPDT
jgi:hypothetical protein